jgi:hypothetical protein
MKSLPKAWHTRFLLFCCSLLLLSSANTEATLMKYLEIEDLTRLSAEVIHGTSLSSKVYWDSNHQRILTDTRVQVSECLKGKTKPGTVITVTQLGGELDGIRMDYSGRPTFSLNEEVVLFTQPNAKNQYIVVGLKQGKLLVKGNEVLRDLGGITFVDAEINSSKSLSQTKGRKVVQTRYAISELRSRIAHLK